MGSYFEPSTLLVLKGARVQRGTRCGPALWEPKVWGVHSDSVVSSTHGQSSVEGPTLGEPPVWGGGCRQTKGRDSMGAELVT
jgi:hypothetical protein